MPRRKSRHQFVEALSRAFETLRARLLGPIRFALMWCEWYEGGRVLNWEEEAPKEIERFRKALSSAPYPELVRVHVSVQEEFADVHERLAESPTNSFARVTEIAEHYLATLERLYQAELEERKAGISLRDIGFKAPSEPVRAQPRQPAGTKSSWYQSSPDVLRRRQIVLKNPNFTAQKHCNVFDGSAPKIPLPSGWEDEFGVTTWVEAYKNKKLRARIQKIISTDKTAR